MIVKVQEIMIFMLTLLLIQPHANAIRLQIPQTKVRIIVVIPRPVLPCLNIATIAQPKNTNKGIVSTNCIELISCSINLFNYFPQLFLINNSLCFVLSKSSKRPYASTLLSLNLINAS